MTPSPPSVTTRPARPEDIDIVLADVQAGFDSYAEFAGPGWQPPNALADRDRGAELLADPGTWGLIAFSHETPIGHVTFFPARDRLELTLVPGLAHLWQLFVMPDWWGRGVAPLLHDAALDEMQARHFWRARLFTPSRHARARKFYERRGWRLTGEEWNENLSLMLVEYQQLLHA